MVRTTTTNHDNNLGLTNIHDEHENDDDLDDIDLEQRMSPEGHQVEVSSSRYPAIRRQQLRRIRRAASGTTTTSNNNNSVGGFLSSIRGWMFYDPVASTNDEEEDDGAPDEHPPSSSSPLPQQPPLARQQAVSDSTSSRDTSSGSENSPSNDRTSRDNTASSLRSNDMARDGNHENHHPDNNQEASHDEESNVVAVGSNDKNTPMVEIVILDYMHQKFTVSVPANGTIYDVKKYGAMVHKVPISRQRLIYRGQLLLDEQTLVSRNITTDHCIIHLFPKPRVVVVGNNKDDDETNHDDTTAHRTDGSRAPPANGSQRGGSGNAGARIPTIVLNAEEAERRSQILVLGSPDYIEAQNNVKLFSFMLLIISSIELLNLFAIAMGVPQQQQQAQLAAQQNANSPGSSSFPSRNNNNNNNNNGGMPLTNNMDDDIDFFPYMNNNGTADHDPLFDDPTNSSYSYSNFSNYDDTMIMNNTLFTSTIVPNVSYSNFDTNENNPFILDDLILNYEQQQEFGQEAWQPEQHQPEQPQTDPAIISLYQRWNQLSYIDLAVSLLGVYVALLGIRATNENQLKVAKMYLYGTVITAIGWLLYNFIISYKVDELILHENIDNFQYSHQNHHNNQSSLLNDPYAPLELNDDWYENNNRDDDVLFQDANNNNNNNNNYNSLNQPPYTNIRSQHDVMTNALQVMILPTMVWLLCIYRAFQFSYLLYEAETEAHERIRDELRMNHDDDDPNHHDNTNHTNPQRPSSSTTTTLSTTDASSSSSAPPSGTTTMATTGLIV